MEQQVTTYCASLLTGDDLLRKFWEVEDCNFDKRSMSLDEKSVIKHFEDTHTRDKSGRFIVPLPRNDDVTPLGERSKAAKRFLNLKQSLIAKGSSTKLIKAMDELFEMRHADPVPTVKTAWVIHAFFYVDDGLTGGNTIQEVRDLQRQLQELFAQKGFVLHKWKTSAPAALNHVPPHLLDEQTTDEIIDANNFMKVLGVEWNAELDCFRPMIDYLSSIKMLTQRTLVTDIAGIYDVLGWCLPSIVKPKILLQRLWEDRLNWDEPLCNNML